MVQTYPSSYSLWPMSPFQRGGRTREPHKSPTCCFIKLPSLLHKSAVISCCPWQREQCYRVLDEHPCCLLTGNARERWGLLTAPHHCPYRQPRADTVSVAELMSADPPCGQAPGVHWACPPSPSRQSPIGTSSHREEGLRGLERGWECHPRADSPTWGNLRQENEGSHLVPANTYCFCEFQAVPRC